MANGSAIRAAKSKKKINNQSKKTSGVAWRRHRAWRSQRQQNSGRQPARGNIVKIISGGQRRKQAAQLKNENENVSGRKYRRKVASWQ
jgi:hypothetical protein